MEKIEFKCQALGSPNPKYTWVDKEGIDATEKEGKTLIAISLVNHPSPQRGDSPREQYISDEEDNFIVLYQLF